MASGGDFTCSSELRERIADNLSRFSVRRLDAEAGTRAAVAVVVVDAAGGTGGLHLAYHDGDASTAALVLTRRAAHLTNHAGQWALPGGRMDRGETAEAAALRELSEEVSLHLSPHRVMGRLDDFATRSGFVMTPVVIWGGSGVCLSANPEEVASIHRIPVSEFLREDAPVLESSPAGDEPVLLMPVGDNFIAAPTAAVIFQFREVGLLGAATRVAHYDQPFFAWR